MNDDDFMDLTNHIYERFNPSDDDCTHPWGVVDDAADFIEAQSCDCPHDPAEDTCRRCEVLGRRRDEVISR